MLPPEAGGMSPRKSVSLRDHALSTNSLARQTNSTFMSLLFSVLTVSGLRRRASLMSELEAAVARHQPDAVAFVGDFLRTGFPNEGQLTNEQLAHRLSKLSCKELILIPGIEENDDWFSFQAELDQAGRHHHALSRRCCNLGHTALVGFPCPPQPEPSFVIPHTSDAPAPERQQRAWEWQTWLPGCLRRYWSSSRTLWFMSEPPHGTRLTHLSGPLAGSEDWRAAIHEFAPLLVVCGGDHQSPVSSGNWHDRVRFSTVINVGQTHSGPLHYAVIEAVFASDSASLPDSLKVTCHPKGELLQVR